MTKRSAYTNHSTRLLPLFLFLPLLLYAALTATTPSLTVELSPANLSANTPTSLRLNLTATTALSPGDRIAVVIPPSWAVHAMRLDERDGRTFGNQPYPQLTKDLAPKIRITSSHRDFSEIHTLLELSHDGTFHRFGRTLEIKLESALPKGQTLTVSYGTQAQPVYASFLAETVRFPVRLNGRPQAAPTVTTTPLPAERLAFTAQSTARIGERVRFHASARDLFDNPTALPPSLTIGEETIETGTRFWLDYFAAFDQPGFHTLTASGGVLDPVESNPVRVTAEEPPVRLYWGDLHSHSSMSKDGIGETPWTFARDYANLDFYSLTDHTSGDRGDNGITGAEWQRTQADVRAFHQPGRFVTLLAYEVSFGPPWGHHNVYYNTDTGPLFRRHEVKTLPPLWEKLAGRDAFTVPHHTGINFSANPEAKATVWDAATAPKRNTRPLIEIYSGHGHSEMFAPGAPNAYDNLIFIQRWKNWFQRSAPETPEEYRRLAGPVSVRGPAYARDAWAMGLEMGTIASSDDHTARPGQPEKGLAAVWAKRLDRRSIYNALVNRATYATTGERIYLDFHRTPAGRLEFEAHGAAPIAFIELMEYDGSRWKVARKWTPGAPHATGSHAPSLGSLYYLRLRQTNTVKGRPVMAWSSPISAKSAPW